MTGRTATSRLGLGFVVAVLLVACGGNAEDDLSAAEREWSSTGIDDYNLMLQISCFCPMAGSFDVTVQDGQVMEITADGAVVEAPGGVTPSDWFTVEGLFDIVSENLDADRVDVSYGEQGYPTSIDIDIDRDEADDSLRISTDLQAG